MVGEEQQRCDEPSVIKVCRVGLGSWSGANHYGTVTLPYKKVTAVMGINMPNDTHWARPIRIVAPNVLHYYAKVVATGAEPANLTAMGNAEVTVVVPYD